MARFAILPVLVGLAAFAGCRTKPYVNAHIESLNAEYRQLEDYVYALEEENARLQQERDALRARRIDRTRDDAPGPPRLRPGAGPELDVPRIDVPRIDVPRTSPEDAEPPMIEIPDVPAAPLPPPRPGGIRPASADLTPTEPADRRVTQLFLNPLFTAADGDRLNVVLQPRNADDQYVPEPGAVSVVVLDPSRHGEAARVARWDLAAEETRQLLQWTGAAPGIKLELPWPAAPPTGERLQLFVRYETPDGGKLQAEQEIAVIRREDTISRWTPRPPERQRPALEEPQLAAADAAVETASLQTPIAPAKRGPALPPSDLSGELAGQQPLPRWSPHR